MGVFYVVSVEEAAGKTAICAGLGKYLIGEGKKVGYLKPPAPGNSGADTDVVFIRAALGLPDTVSAPDIIKDNDVVLIEGRVGPKAADGVSRATYEAVKETKAKVIAVEAYTGQASPFIDSYQGFGDSLLGVVINKVPRSRLGQTGERAKADFKAAGIDILGLIPENRRLLAMTVGELAEGIRGRILNNADKSAELVENYMLGAMVVDSGLDYFGRKDNKAAIIRQDRPDMQLAALETSTSCLVLSGGDEAPNYNVLQKAEVRGIPVIATGAGTDDVIANIEDALNKTRFNQKQKLPVLAEMVAKNLDLKVLA